MLGHYLVVVVVPANSDRVHDKFAPVVIAWGAVGNVVRVMLCPKVVSQLMGGHQVCLLDTEQTGNRERDREEEKHNHVVSSVDHLDLRNCLAWTTNKLGQQLHNIG